MRYHSLYALHGEHMILDEKEINRLKAHDESLFESLYQQTKIGVYAMIFGIVKNHMLAEDIMQDVYMKMLIKIDQYRLGSNFYNWLLQIAKYQAIDVYRRQRKEDLVEVEQVDYRVNHQQENPDKEDHLLHMLSVLDDDEKDIVLLKIVDDWTFKAISKHIHKPLGTVLWLYQRAMRKMKDWSGFDEEA